MVHGTKIAQLSEEDLIEWREVMAAYEVVMAGGCSWEEKYSVAAVVRYYETFAFLKGKYVPGEEGCISIGAVHGDVLSCPDDE